MSKLIMNKKSIISEMRVQTTIDVSLELEKRIEFIKRLLTQSNMKTLVLGISGGIDSTTLGKMAQLAVDQLNQKSMGYRFVAIRLPYGEQTDEADAQSALDFIKPTESLTINVKRSVDKAHESVISSLINQNLLSQKQPNIDFVMGNVKARHRMVAQYEVAGLLNGLVLGTDHSAENITGFYTKWGDGACDLAPLFGLSKRQVKQLGRFLGVPDRLVSKSPTADLETLNPGKTDEEALGITYTQIDDFLEGLSNDEETDNIIIELFKRTQHKRKPIPTLFD